MNKHVETGDEWEGDPSDSGKPSRQALSRQENRGLTQDYYRDEFDEDDEEFNILEYAHILTKHSWLIAGVTAIVGALALTATLLMTPQYRATVTIQIDRDAVQIVNIGGVEAEQGVGAEFFLTQYELLRSRAVAERVVQEENLTDDATLHALDIPSAFTRLKNIFLGAEDPAPVSDPAAAERDATELVMEGLTVAPIIGSRLVELSFDSQDPVLSQRIVNSFATSFIALNLERRYTSSSYARAFLEDRLVEQQQKLEESERALISYAREEQIINFSDSQSLVGTNLIALNSALTEARANRIQLEGLWLQAQASIGLGLPQILESQSIQTLRQSRAVLQTAYQQNSSIFQPAFPEMVRLQAQIDEIDRQVEAEIENIKESIRAEYEAALAQENSFQEQVSKLTADVFALSDRTVQYNILQREVETSRGIFDALLLRYREVGVAAGVGTNNVSVVDAAQTPDERHSPNIPLNLAIALFVGLASGIMAAFLGEQINDRIKTPEEVERILGLTLLGVIPHLRKKMSIKDALDSQRSGFAEAYRSVRTSLQFCTPDGAPNTLLVTSPSPGEGKSTTAAALALKFVQLGKSVLLVDGDLRAPSLHQIFGCDNRVGLSSYLSGAATIEEVVQDAHIDGLQLLPSGPLPPNPAELLVGAKMVLLLSLSAAKFDIVIIDGPPVMGISDAPILATIAEGTMLVIESASSRKALANQAIKRLRHVRALLLGAVLSKFETKHAGYGYGYGYGSTAHYAYGENPKIEN